MTLIERWNYHNELGAQFPTPPLRVVYAKAGTLPAASLVRDEPIIDTSLYWAAPHSEAEGHYLSAILNSETARARVAAIQARGQWGARHFDKVIFALSIPRFDPSQPLHNDLAAAAAEAERIAASFELPETVKFRGRGREASARIRARNGAAQGRMTNLSLEGGGRRDCHSVA